MPFSIIGKLLGWTGLPTWLLEILAFVAVVAGIWYSGVFHEKGVIEMRTLKQVVHIDHEVIITGQSNEQELQELRKYRTDHPISSIKFGVCNPNTVPPRPTEGRPSTETGTVQPVPAGDSGVPTVQAGRSVDGMLDAFGGRCDQVSAELRRRQKLEP